MRLFGFEYTDTKGFTEYLSMAWLTAPARARRAAAGNSHGPLHALIALFKTPEGRLAHALFETLLTISVFSGLFFL